MWFVLKSINGWSIIISFNCVDIRWDTGEGKKIISESSELGQVVNKVWTWYWQREGEDEAASPTGQAKLSSMPSHMAPDVCHLVVNLN